jgi:hypothetical protein
VSRQSDRKKARRQKRLAQRVVWSSIVDDSRDEPTDTADPGDIEGLVEQAQVFDRRITQRQWTFDAENSTAGLASWFYAPSGYQPEDEDVEAVTRVWFTTASLDDFENFPQTVHVILAGSTQARRLSAEQFFDELAAIEAHRANGR